MFGSNLPITLDMLFLAFIYSVITLPVISNNDDWIMGIEVNVGQFCFLLLDNNLVTQWIIFINTQIIDKNLKGKYK